MGAAFFALFLPTEGGPQKIAIHRKKGAKWHVTAGAKEQKLIIQMRKKTI